MLQDTIARMGHSQDLKIAPPSFVCAGADEHSVRAQCKDMGIAPHHIILEPVGRNTAPVAAIVTEIIHGQDPDGLVLLLPADHYIADPDAFWRCVEHGIDMASQNHLVTFGIHPTRPETGYGYIRKKAALADMVFGVDAFVEKPDGATAQRYVDSGDYFWNAGIFLFAPQTMLAALKAHAPDILALCQETLEASAHKNGCTYLDKQVFAKCPAQSLDYAVMEKAQKVAVVAPVDMGWDDLGSWAAISDVSPASHGDVLAIDCDSSYLRSDGPLIAGIGLENMIVIATNDAVLIVPKDKAQDVKKIVNLLKDKGRDELL